MSTWKQRRSQHDFDREIGAHIALETDRLVEEGLAPEEARAEAARRFGNVTRARERFHEAGRRLWLDHVVHDLRCAVRNLRRYPVAAIVGVASLAAGIGATTATLTIRNAVFYNMPPLYERPEELSRVYVAPLDRIINPIASPVPLALYRRWREALGPSIAAAAVPRGVQDVRVADRVSPVAVRAATPGLFSLLGILPVVGHLPDGAQPDAVLIGYRVWQELFDRRPDVVGQVLWIDDRPYSVAGVLPERFWFSDMSSPVWTLLDADRESADLQLDVVVRRSAGETDTALDGRLRPVLEDYARRAGGGLRLHMRVAGVEGTPLAHQMAIVLPYILGMSVLLTLVIACANVAILMIAQWTAREHEIAVRASIGAGRSRIVQMLLTESVVVAACGGVLGVLATFALRGWILHRVPAALELFDLRISPGILARSAVATLLAGVAVGMAPALYETRRLQVNPQRAMRTSEVVRQRWRHSLVVLEITVTIALLVETSALVTGYFRARNAELGYSPHPLLTARVERSGGVALKDLLDAVTHVPGVAAAAASTSVPLGASGSTQRVSPDGSGSRFVLAEQALITDGFFNTLGVPLKAGRLFSGADSDKTRTAIVNETLARELYGGRDGIGARLWIAGRAYDVVGIVADYANNPLRARVPQPRVFVPMPASNESRRVQLLIRAEADPAPLVAAIRREIRDAHTGAQVTSAYTLEDIIAAAGQELLVGTAPLFPLVAIGLLLTATGIFGVLAFGMARRARELAVRVAVGARGVDLVRLVSGETLKLVSTGSALGIAATFALARAARAGGGAGSVFDPPVGAFVLPVVIVMAVAALAAWIPSRRAVKIDPSVLLRLE